MTLLSFYCSSPTLCTAGYIFVVSLSMHAQPGSSCCASSVLCWEASFFNVFFFNPKGVYTRSQHHYSLHAQVDYSWRLTLGNKCLLTDLPCSRVDCVRSIRIWLAMIDRSFSHSTFDHRPKWCMLTTLTGCNVAGTTGKYRHLSRLTLRSHKFKVQGSHKVQGFYWAVWPWGSKNIK